MQLLDDFLVRAVLAGIGVALITGPLGCFVVWRRLAYFGETLAHASLLGAALAFAMEINAILSIFLVALALAIGLVYLERGRILATDTLIGILSPAVLALGVIVISLMTSLRIDLNSLLFGDILAVSKSDLVVIYIGGFVVLSGLAVIWRDLFAATVNRDLAISEGIRADRLSYIFLVMLALTIALAIKIVGVLLIAALMIIPAAASRSLARTPELMAALASVIGTTSVVLGLSASATWDTPSGASIVLAAVVLFALSQVPWVKMVVVLKKKER